MTLKIEPKEDNNAITTVFMDELCEINLSGLKILSSLSTFIIGMLTEVKLASINDVITMKKSN